MLHTYKIAAVKPGYIVNKVSNSEVDFLLYGIIGEDWWNDIDNTANTVVAELSRLQLIYKIINIHINTPGGSVYDGVAIANKISSSEQFTTCNDGWAFSMGGPILLAANHVRAYKASMIMIHSASDIVWGNAAEMRAKATELEAHEANTLIPFIADRAKMTTDEVTAKWFDGKEHFIGATEALQLGLIDQIIGQESEMPDVADKTHNQIFASFCKNKELFTPQQIGNGWKSKVAAMFAGGNKTPKNTTDTKTQNTQPGNTNTMKTTTNHNKAFPTIANIVTAFAEDEEGNTALLSPQVTEIEEHLKATATAHAKAIKESAEQLVTAQQETVTKTEELATAQAEIDRLTAETTEQKTKLETTGTASVALNTTTVVELDKETEAGYIAAGWSQDSINQAKSAGAILN